MAHPPLKSGNNIEIVGLTLKECTTSKMLGLTIDGTWTYKVQDSQLKELSMRRTGWTDNHLFIFR